MGITYIQQKINGTMTVVGMRRDKKQKAFNKMFETKVEDNIDYHTIKMRTRKNNTIKEIYIVYTFNSEVYIRLHIKQPTNIYQLLSKQHNMTYLVIQDKKGNSLLIDENDKKIDKVPIGNVKYLQLYYNDDFTEEEFKYFTNNESTEFIKNLMQN